MTDPVYILGIESSCDDTAAAVLRADADSHAVLSSVVMGQTELHKAFGGVVPEIAARAHAEKLDLAVEQALEEANIQITDLTAVAATAGPGLVGGVVSGLMCAKGLAAALNIPLIGVNHLAGHALSPQIEGQSPFPYLMLLVSGGHCQFLIAKSDDKFIRIGGTIDDAPGEAFDKAARILGLPQPGGPAIEEAAKQGDPKCFDLPRPLLNRDGCDMSFSGLKTALLRARDAVLNDQNEIARQDQCDLAASFQAAVTDILKVKSQRAFQRYLEFEPKHPCFAVAGGVAANQTIRGDLKQVAQDAGAQFVAPPMKYCTDNAAMIAYAGLTKFKRSDFDGFDLSARPRWPLDSESPSMLGSGKKGAKA